MTSPAQRRMRSTGVSLGVTVLMAAGLSGCASSPDYQAVCVDPSTEQRVSDEDCGDGSQGTGAGSAFLWYYLASTARVPAVGSGVGGGTFDTSRVGGRVIRGGLPSTGGSSVESTTRSGGFGGTSRSFSG